MDPREADTLAALCILVMEEMGEKWGCLGVEGTREESLHGFFFKKCFIITEFLQHTLAHRSSPRTEDF